MSVLELPQPASLTVEFPGQVNAEPRQLRLNANNFTYDQILTEGFINQYFPSCVSSIKETDWFLTNYSGGGGGEFRCKFGPNGRIDLYDTGSSVTIPVTVGNFAVFANENGGIKDAGFSPSDASKTNVVMVNTPTTINRIAVFADTNGTLTKDASTAIHDGNIQAGENASQGGFFSYPLTANKGNINLFATANSGNFNIGITNVPYGQSTTLNIPDPGSATASFLVSAGASDVSSNNVYKLTNVTAANLASGAHVVVFPSSGSKQYRINRILFGKGSNFTSPGDRDLQLTDGSTIFTTITAAQLLSQTNAIWGDSGVPLPVGFAMTSSTGPGVSLYLQYVNGTADYPNGNFNFGIEVQRIA